MSAKKNALLSVYNKTGIEDFTRGLIKLGWKIYASGGSAKKIQAAGIEVTDVAELVGSQSILDHRVVTLSREIHAGLLADKTSQHEDELKRFGIARIDLVCVDMYPLQEAINTPGSSEKSVREMTDIGGPAMLRAGAKGRRIVICRLEQRQQVLNWLKAGRPDEENFLRELAGIAELEVARYVLNSARYLNQTKVAGFIGELLASAKYGENPWQQNAGVYTEESNTDPLSLSNFRLQQGAELSFNNWADIDRLLQTITHIAAGFDKNFAKVPFIVVGVKHGNACGGAVASEPAEAIKKMLEGDPRAIFGGSVMMNFSLDKNLAELLMRHGVVQGKRLLDVIVAADASNQALKVLQRKEGKLRIVTSRALAKLSKDSLDKSRRFRNIRGGMLAQDNYTFIFDRQSTQLQAHGKVNLKQLRDMVLAWAIGSTSNSNTITLVKNGMLIGNGVGQQDRVSAAELALKRARDGAHDAAGAVAYSDSFFPFPDGPLVLAQAGVSAILATHGSINDKQVAQALKKKGVVFYTLRDSSARGFYAH